VVVCRNDPDFGLAIFEIKKGPSMAKNELLDLINSFPDAESRARAIHERCLWLTNDPKLRKVINIAAMGDGYYSRLLATSLPPPDKKSRNGAPRRRRPNHPVNPSWKKDDR